MSLIRECVRKTEGYVPGEQPQTDKFIKLNTNENPYPLPPQVLTALQKEIHSLNLYPDPECTTLRKAAASVFGISDKQIVVGNGSDEILSIALRTFVDPPEAIATIDLTYSLYETLAKIHGSPLVCIPTNANFELDEPVICPQAKLIFLASPNPPLGKQIKREYLEETCAQATGVVVIDEAYVDFSDYNHLDLLQYENVIITRTMSKAYSLAGVRVGFGLASKNFIREMNKVRDSYNVHRLAQTIATAAFESHSYFQQIWLKIRETRNRLITSLRELNFLVFDSEANFVLASPQWIEASKLYIQLKENGILVRYFQHPRLKNYLRISVGTNSEIDILLKTLTRLQKA